MIAAPMSAWAKRQYLVAICASTHPQRSQSTCPGQHSVQAQDDACAESTVLFRAAAKKASAWWSHFCFSTLSPDPWLFELGRESYSLSSSSCCIAWDACRVFPSLSCLASTKSQFVCPVQQAWVCACRQGSHSLWRTGSESPELYYASRRIFGHMKF